MKNLREDLLKELTRRKWEGIRQNEIYRALPYSRSHVSETISRLAAEGVVIREREKKASRTVWLADFYPRHVAGMVRAGILRSSEYVPFLSSLKKTCTAFQFDLRIKVFNSAPELISHLHNSVLDIALAPTFTHILFSLTTGREAIISSVAGGGSSLVKNTVAESTELATSESSTMNLLSRRLVNKENLGVTFYSDPGDAVTRFLKGDFRYLAIWEPYLSSIKEKEGFEDLSEDPDVSLLNPCCSAGVNREFLSGNRAFVEDMVNNYSVCVSELSRDELSYGLNIVSEATGFTVEAVYESLKSYTFYASTSISILQKYMYEVGIPLSADLLKSMIL